jgi:PTS system mannose-specific IIA component
VKKSVLSEVQPDLPGIIVLSHGDMALGMLNSAQVICGELENVVALGLEPGDDLEAYREEVAGLLDAFPEGALILVDIMSGTPFNSVMFLGAERELYGIAGANLPLLIELALLRQSMSLKEIAVVAEEKIHASICDLRKFQEELMTRE